MKGENMPNALSEFNFALAGRWRASKNGILFEIDDRNIASSRNVLYAFVVDGDVMYIGKSRLRLHDRMQRYKTPAKTSENGGATNIKNNKHIRESLDRDESVEIFVWCDDGTVNHRGLHVDVAAGLEHSLINELDPPWNNDKKR
jgi:hypothetical protein